MKRNAYKIGFTLILVCLSVLITQGVAGAQGTNSFSGTVSVNDIVQFNLITGSMAEIRRDHTATLLNNGKVLVTGGYMFRVIQAVFFYQPSWELGWMPTLSPAH